MTCLVVADLSDAVIGRVRIAQSGEAAFVEHLHGLLIEIEDDAFGT